MVKRVRDALDPRCLVNGGLNRGGCKVSMARAPKPRLAIDFDRPGTRLPLGATRCDFLVVAEGGDGVGWVAPLELKRGRLHADEAVRQLQAGARAAERLIPSGEPLRFRPVVATGRVPKAERRRLRGNDGRIRLHGHVEAVRLMSCGDRLARALHP